MLALLFSFILSAQASWTEGTTVGVRTDGTTLVNAIFINSYTGSGPAAGSWNVVDATSFGIPSDAKSIFLSGILIITHGSTSQTCDISIAFRAYGNTTQTAGNYIGQSVEAHIGGGQRSTMSTFVPLNEGKFEFIWNRNTTGQWPSECAYGINLSAQSYIK